MSVDRLRQLAHRDALPHPFAQTAKHDIGWISAEGAELGVLERRLLDAFIQLVARNEN